jgi:hypothetical protein
MGGLIMAFTGDLLAEGQVAAAWAAIYTSTGVVTILKSVNIYNTAVTSETVEFRVNMSGGGTSQIGRCVLEQDEYAYVLSDGETLVLGSGDALEMQTTNATSVDYVVSGATQ